MQASIENFKTGWCGVSLCIKKSEISGLIQALGQLRDGNTSHFHARSDFSGTGGIADIEFSVIAEHEKDHLSFDYSKPVEPSNE